MTDAEAEYRELLGRAARSPQIVGVVMFGSRAAGPFAEPASDVDCFVIVNGSEAEVRQWQTGHGSPVEVWAMDLEQFRQHGLPGSGSEWNRPALIRARVDLDKMDGEIAQILDRKRRLEPEEARAIIDDALDGAINSTYRALRSLESRRELGGRLDALESIGPWLRTMFALEGRVRPFNKWLALELATEPLTTPAFSGLLGWLEGMTVEPTAERLRATFRMVEDPARGAGHGAVIDGWQPDVQWLRGHAGYRVDRRDV